MSLWDYEKRYSSCTLLHPAEYTVNVGVSWRNSWRHFSYHCGNLVSWSRVLADHELLVVFNTDEINTHELYSTLNPNLRREGDELRLLFSYTPELSSP